MLRARRAMGILILLISLVVLLWGIWPQANLVRTSPLAVVLEAFPIPYVPFRTSYKEDSLMDDIVTSPVFPSISISSPTLKPVTSSIASIPPYFSENRLLVLEWPPSVRVGDAEYLRSTLVVDRQGNSLIRNDVGDNAPGSEVYQNPDSPALDNIIVEAHLDMPGMQYTPTGEISESLHPGQPAMFLWSVRAPKVGTYQGTIWLHVRLTRLEGGSEIRSVLSAPRVEIQAENFLGLNGNAARVLGSVGVVVGSMLGLDGLFSWFWNLFTSLLRVGTKSL